MTDGIENLPARKLSASDYMEMKRFMGQEPVLTASSNRSDITKAFSWYNYFYDHTDAQAFALDFAKANKYDQKIINALKDAASTDFIPLGWILRLVSRGSVLPQELVIRAQEKLSRLAASISHPRDAAAEAGASIAPLAPADDAPHVKLIGHFETEIDSFLARGFKSSFDPYEYMKQADTKAFLANRVVTYYTPLADELKLAISRQDEQVAEAYSKYSALQQKKYLEFVLLVIASAEKISYIKKASRKPRKKKIKTADQLTAKVKFKQTDDQYKVVSVDPSKIIGTTQAWVFNTKTRFLGVYLAENESAPLTIKGTTVLGFSAEKSTQKKLRKPEKILPLVLSEGKVGLRKLLGSVNAKDKPLSGRINSDTLILRVIK